MKYFHKWEILKDTGKHQYIQCEKCGDRQVKKIYGEGHQPIEEGWRKLKRVSLFCKTFC